LSQWSALDPLQMLLNNKILLIICVKNVSGKWLKNNNKKAPRQLFLNQQYYYFGNISNQRIFVFSLCQVWRHFGDIGPKNERNELAATKRAKLIIKVVSSQNWNKERRVPNKSINMPKCRQDKLFEKPKFAQGDTSDENFRKAVFSHI